MDDFTTIMDLNDRLPAYGIKYKSSLPLVGIDGNAFAIMAQVSRGLKRNGAPPDYVKGVMDDMMSGDYDHLLQVAIRYTE